MSEPQLEPKPVSIKTADDVNDLFKTLDDEEDEKPSKGKRDQEDKPDEEVKEPEGKEDIEIVEPDEDEEEPLDLTKDEDIEIDAPPRKKDLLKDYPDLFKKHPFLEKMLYRDRQYNELFGSFDDAKEMAERAEVFADFETQLLAGNTVEVLKNVKETDAKAFDKIVDSYLPSLAKVDKDAYFDVINNISKQLIVEMVKEANESNNEDLKQAALLVNQFLFGSSKFTPPKVRVTETKTDERSEAEQERLSYVQDRFDTARDDLQVRVDNTLKSTISAYIDPKGVMSPYVKKNAVTDALKILHDTLGRDTGLRSSLDRLWKAAFEAKFSKDSLSKIQSHYLGRAKGSLKNAIMKARAEALKDLSPRAEREEKEEEQQETPRRRGPIPTGRPSQPRGKNEMKKGESVSEFFARD